MPRKGETTGFASWYATLWLEEPLTLRAFRSLLGVQPVLLRGGRRHAGGDAQGERHRTSRKSPTNLGYQVREAVEELIRSLDRIDQDEGRQLLAGVPETELYEAALTVMMRLVFLFSAEERGLLLLGDPLYDEHYAVSTLVARLQETADQHGEEILERRHDAWVRLLSTFRAVYGGRQHERMKLLPYAGNLFDPDRFPFLEGRKPGTTWRDTPSHCPRCRSTTARCCTCSGRSNTSKCTARPAGSASGRSTSSRSATSTRACSTTPPSGPTEPVLGLAAAKGDEPEVALAELERLQRRKGEETTCIEVPQGADGHERRVP